MALLLNESKQASEPFLPTFFLADHPNPPRQARQPLRSIGMKDTTALSGPLLVDPLAETIRTLKVHMRNVGVSLTIYVPLDVFKAFLPPRCIRAGLDGPFPSWHGCEAIGPRVGQSGVPEEGSLAVDPRAEPESILGPTLRHP
jgi:hypothetical protein